MVSAFHKFVTFSGGGRGRTKKQPAWKRAVEWFNRSCSKFSFPR
ncbi:hypothetical protein CHCC20441_4027 [Bacillus licheniformis]|uniref:Uncharacterized protein n=1 Tax=Bacillus licheniformis TaxID=1402 RepID=A0A8B5Y7E7_BACLI|nr:hypothetical protein MUY_002109 [Bacillus licheniformis WX-02]KYC68428.1 hypothetical protein B4092_2178 [Bacillus licheniformis]TWN16678.1 hypothetical protein CHCC14564_1243 [Bacillus licheniformis LMG 17339]KYC75491.1 hypothetical protein B4090_2177 [Bacillus licheniformis]KYC83709.1 hypothetical protein B4091_2287 [Bacillus licheniformis]